MCITYAACAVHEKIGVSDITGDPSTESELNTEKETEDSPKVYQKQEVSEKRSPYLGRHKNKAG
ncbi:MAG: hypothetical protein E7623_06985 [Ruminococcaceae bacterium]|nr:hypothetical protein [Oscillospiraceae bacterium]